MSAQRNKLAGKPAVDESDCSLRLLTVLQEMAAQETNAVLQVLKDVEHLKTECRYPDSGILFAGKRWRAFYHCHEASSMHADEHGHFHIFTVAGSGEWSHVAGLSIDREGQPLQWFMVNRWVTDGPWLRLEDFLRQLTFAKVCDRSDAMVENWLSGLLQLYRDDLYALLQRRDAVITSHLDTRSSEEVFDDRDIYTLATQPVDLQRALEKHLLPAPASAPLRTSQTISRQGF